MFGNELRASRLKVLHKKLLECEEMYGIFHAAVRSDDPAIDSLFMGGRSCDSLMESLFVIEGVDDRYLPGELCELLFDTFLGNEMDTKLVPPKGLSFRELFELATTPEFAKRVPLDSDSALRVQNELKEFIWAIVRREPGIGSRISELAPAHRDRHVHDIRIAEIKWHGCLFSKDESNGAWLKLAPLVQLVLGELVSIRDVNWYLDFQIGFEWIEVLYSLLPQPIEDICGIKTIMLPWNLAESSARAVERLIDEPNLRFDELGPGISEPANGRLRAEALTADSELATAEVIREQNNHLTNTPKVTFNSRMIDKIQSLPESCDWSAREWVEFLDCSVSTVHAQPMWAELMKLREETKVARQMKSRTPKNDTRVNRKPKQPD